LWWRGLMALLSQCVQTQAQELLLKKEEKTM